MNEISFYKPANAQYKIQNFQKNHKTTYQTNRNVSDNLHFTGNVSAKKAVNVLKKGIQKAVKKVVLDPIILDKAGTISKLEADKMKILDQLKDNLLAQEKMKDFYHIWEEDIAKLSKWNTYDNSAKMGDYLNHSSYLTEELNYDADNIRLLKKFLYQHTHDEFSNIKDFFWSFDFETGLRNIKRLGQKLNKE